jgi:hypothetical protein
MTPTPEEWSPHPELLAAYFDGELAGRPDHEALRSRIAAWLRRHPEAREVFADYCRLSELWHDTTPPDPGPEIWTDVATQLDARCRVLPARKQGRRLVVLLASAAAIALVVGLGVGRRLTEQRAPVALTQPAPTADEEVLPVATAAEVAILRIEGADTQTLVVGELPVGGPLELAGPGEVALTSVQPDAHDQMMPHVRVDGSRRPLIWARVEPESMEP